jgi:hypothetical protein
MVLILSRYGEPNKFDQHPQGTLCKVWVGLDGDYMVYKQMSSDENNPVWEQIEKRDVLVVTACGEK